MSYQRYLKVECIKVVHGLIIDGIVHGLIIDGTNYIKYSTGQLEL